MNSNNGNEPNNNDGDPFPIRLYNVLQNQDLRDILEFVSHGRAFRILDEDRFVNEVLPVWFNERDWEGFHYQLDIHGFHRLTQGRDQGAFYHQLFLRSMRFLADQITADPNREPIQPSFEPDFYLMPVLDNPEPRGRMAVAPGPVFHEDLSAFRPIVGNSTMAPGTVGYPVLPRLTAPLERRDDGVFASHFNSQSILLDSHASELALHNFLRAACEGTEQSTTPGGGEGEDQDQYQSEGKQEDEAESKQEEPNAGRNQDEEMDDN